MVQFVQNRRSKFKETRLWVTLFCSVWNSVFTTSLTRSEIMAEVRNAFRANPFLLFTGKERPNRVTPEEIKLMLLAKKYFLQKEKSIFVA